MTHIPGKIDAAASAAHPTSDRPIYDGLAWSAAADGRRMARSVTTPATYIVQATGDGRSLARIGFEASAGRPNVEIGVFFEERIAILACERHDYRFWKSGYDRAGIETIFHGSADHVADFVASLPDHERTDLLDMIAGDFVLPDGRSFTTAASFFPGVKSGLKQERTGSYTLTLSVAAEDVPLWLMQVAPGAKLVLGAADIEPGATDEWRERGEHAMRRVFALQADDTFHGWLAQRYDRWGLVAAAAAQTSEEVQEAVAETLRRLIGCPSRRELLTNRDAITRLERLDREYYFDLSRETR